MLRISYLGVIIQPIGKGRIALCVDILTVNRIDSQHKKLTPRHRVSIPSNPTGAALSKEFLFSVAKVVRISKLSSPTNALSSSSTSSSLHHLHSFLSNLPEPSQRTYCPSSVRFPTSEQTDLSLKHRTYDLSQQGDGFRHYWLVTAY